MNIDGLVTALKRDEGFRPYLYDDSTGEPIKKGCHVFGNPTVAYGWCPSTRLCPEDLGEIILRYQINETWNEILKDIPWLNTSPENIQEAICDMGFNLGVHGLLGFNTFLGLVKTGKYKEAADDLGGTLWFKQVGSRAKRIQGLIYAQHV